MKSHAAQSRRSVLSRETSLFDRKPRFFGGSRQRATVPLFSLSAHASSRSSAHALRSPRLRGPTSQEMPKAKSLGSSICPPWGYPNPISSLCSRLYASTACFWSTSFQIKSPAIANANTKITRLRRRDFMTPSISLTTGMRVGSGWRCNGTGWRMERKARSGAAGCKGRRAWWDRSAGRRLRAPGAGSPLTRSLPRSRQHRGDRRAARRP